MKAIVDNYADIIVIGGGPAGSTVTTQLAKQGHQVLLLEKAQFPREHVGESLLPFCYELFEELGILDQLQQKFVRKPGVRFINAAGDCYTNWCFNHVIKDESYLSFHVVRSEFDNLLLENSRKHGVMVQEQTKVRRVNLQTHDGLVEVYVSGPKHESQVYKSRFLIDASGRQSVLATQQGWRKSHPGLQRTALWTHWHGSHQHMEGLEEGLATIIYLGGRKRGWMWVFPLAVDRVTIGVVLETDYLQMIRRELIDNGSKDWCLDLYQREIMASDFVKRLLKDAQITSPLKVEGDYSYYTEKKYGDNFALVGDASCFIDPIFSSGVYLSMKSSFVIAESLHNKLTDTCSQAGGNVLLEQAYKRINGAYGLVHRLINLYYSPHAINFAEAGAHQLDHKSHENALAAAHFMLAGDFFEKYEEYGRFIDYLEDPTLFEGYRNYVIERNDFQTQSCGANPKQVFPMLS